jgi:transcriptional regulator with GAF, ATPase, and Fis domain|tara:strand:- start:378 stop:605 length:228 start_codon:yes stop_codon:yes gene_type:complete
MAEKKSKKMLAVEKRQRRELESLLPELVNELGLTGAAKKLNLTKATLSYWLLKLGIRIRRVALKPDETIEIKRIS